jgi:LAO/AO transport system kinase
VAADAEFVRRVVRNDRAAVSRAISMVENGHRDATALLKALFPSTGKAHRIGITGPPGSGKSTITNKLAALYRGKNLRVGIIAVDPSSPFTGGALLGDRIRMTEVELDEGVFIRSMASRGSLGGLSRKAKEAADILDASGCDVIFFETVGVGQSELDIVGAADTVVVVLVPESGDSIQAMKAGLMEIADFFVLNKSDRAGAEQAVRAIKTVLGMRPQTDGWKPDVIQCVATEGKGVARVEEEIAAYRKYLTEGGGLERKRRARAVERIREIVSDRMRVEFWDDGREKLLEEQVAHLSSAETTPYDIAERLLRDFGR